MGAGIPMRLKIPSINVNAVIESVGLTAQMAMDTSDDPDNVGWYNLGPRPGQEGAAVLAGHLDWYEGEKSVFEHLDQLRPGDGISVETDTGMSLTYVVRGIRMYQPDEYAPEVFQQRVGKHLNLVTCGGAWDPVRKIYSERLVVFAEAV
jgi:LPXTG-site transpeptidase (sortase) family protein